MNKKTLFLLLLATIFIPNIALARDTNWEALISITQWLVGVLIVIFIPIYTIIFIRTMINARRGKVFNQTGLIIQYLIIGIYVVLEILYIIMFISTEKNEYYSRPISEIIIVALVSSSPLIILLALLIWQKLYQKKKLSNKNIQE